MENLILASAFSIIASKFLDCYTTHRKIYYNAQERNPLAKILMDRIGQKTSIWLIFLLSVLIVALSTWILFRFYPLPFYQVLFIGTALVITLVQLAVALSNYTGRSNFITRILLRVI